MALLLISFSLIALIGVESNSWHVLKSDSQPFAETRQGLMYDPLGICGEIPIRYFALILMLVLWKECLRWKECLFRRSKVPKAVVEFSRERDTAEGGWQKKKWDHCRISSNVLLTANIFTAPSLPIRVDQAVMPMPWGSLPALRIRAFRVTTVEVLNINNCTIDWKSCTQNCFKNWNYSIPEPISQVLSRGTLRRTPSLSLPSRVPTAGTQGTRPWLCWGSFVRSSKGQHLPRPDWGARHWSVPRWDPWCCTMELH